MSTLYVVATPIGNLQDISKRAVSVLQECDAVFSEVPRTTSKLLASLKLAKPIHSTLGPGRRSSVPLLQAMLADGKKIALVSEAGTPGVNDPGGEFVQAARKAGHGVVPIPGPNAAITAASVSGFPVDEFVFKGFVPHKKGRQTFFSEISETSVAVIFYESPHRIRKTLEALAQVMPDRLICIARELTKLHEQIIVASARDLATFDEQKLPILGEFVVVVSPT
jgi:16S rRNA (cytidine1402-2'-O)-methyltransferase